MKSVPLSYTKVFTNVGESVHCLNNKLDALSTIVGVLAEEAGYNESTTFGIMALFEDAQMHAQSLIQYFKTTTPIVLEEAPPTKLKPQTKRVRKTKPTS